MIYDCFLYAYEEDALAVRVEELSAVPDLVHVALQADVDLRYGAREVARLAHPRLVTVVVTELPPVLDPKALERHLRRRLPPAADGVGCEPDDVVVVSDADEVPSAWQLTEAASIVSNVGGQVTLACDYRELKADWRAPDEWQPPHQAYAALRGRDHDAQANRERTANPGWRVAGGWHLSSMGGPENVARKLRTFSHDELDPKYQDLDWLARCEREGIDLLDRFRLEPVERAPGQLPRCVLEQDRFKHLLRETT